VEFRFNNEPMTMTITFTPIDIAGADRGEFTRFMTRNSFPFHQNANPTDEQVDATIDGGGYRRRVPLWIDETEHGRIGIAVLDAVAGPAPTFDLRLGTRYRGLGLGAPILRDLVTRVFTEHPAATRLEGQTRADHAAMRRTFERAGFVKEAHYRDGWPIPGSEPVASVGYAVLRRDWASGTTTPVDWDDLATGRSAASS
jgi:RimJ/RimL family protein N-acetyltransferase